MRVALAFDFGYKRIGTAVGQCITKTASPLRVLAAQQGVPDWREVQKLLDMWQPQILVVGLPTDVHHQALYTTEAAQAFAQTLQERFALPVALVDERYSTVEARSRLFEQGGYQKIQKSSVDCLAACIILEQWFLESESPE
ncbi:MAG: Holliday junction resolvase RuvX [Legionellaceae bacterium]|nr:Holliday junction resolvase RuvX [Legionellaceae bacterium]